MDEDRLRRYWEKINLISERSTQIEEWTAIPSEDFIADEKTKLATYKAFQEIAEASMDIVAMMCKDSKIPPKDDYTNIELLRSKHFQNMELLVEVNGLRNRLVHRYNAIDDLLAFESIKGILPEIRKFAAGVRRWIRETLRK